MYVHNFLSCAYYAYITVRNKVRIIRRVARRRQNSTDSHDYRSWRFLNLLFDYLLVRGTVYTETRSVMFAGVLNMDHRVHRVPR